MDRSVPVALRPARAEDAEEICHVLIRSIREVCGPDYGNDEVLLASWCANKKPEIVRSWLIDPENRAYVALDAEGLIAGVAAMHASGPGESFEVRLCYVLPEALGKGYGHALIARLEDDARRLGAPTLLLTSTSTARPFYERHGFVPSGPAEPRGPGRQYPMVKPL